MISKVAKNRHNILIIAITRMGDLLQASPTLMGLREENPEAKITLMIDNQFASICRGIPEIDEVYEVDLSLICRCLKRGGEGVTDAYQYLDDLLTDLRAREFDYCFNMSSSAYTALLLKMLEVPESLGWMADEEGYRLITNPWAMLFAAFVFHSNRDFNSINLVDIVRCSAGVTAHPRSLRYNIPEQDRGFCKKFLSEAGIQGGGPLICVQTGASQGKRQWAPARFAHVIRQLVENLDARIVLTGSSEELPIIQLVQQCYSSPHITVAAGKTNLGQLASLLLEADLLITGDTGPMHMSVAVGTPVVALFLASALCHETGPYSEGNIILQPRIGCNPCNPNYPCSKPDCHDQVSPELVYTMAKTRLELSTQEVLKLKVPDSIADPSQVSVMVSTFDEDDFLIFQRVNGIASRNGLPTTFYETAQMAYRKLWKEELNAVAKKPVEGSFSQGSENQSPIPEVVSHGLRQAIECCHRGQLLLSELESLVKDKKSSPYRLGEVNDAIDENDSNIESIGLSNPVLGALIRMFIMEKENMRGDDPLQLASEMRTLYGTLNARARKFGNLFERYHVESTR